MVNSETSVLVVYSNPGNSDRLRLDREHRALDEVLDHSGAPDGLIKRLHATTIKDLITALRKPDIHIVHFSGHGSSEGIYMESSEEGESGTLLTADALAELVKSSCKHVQALILASCFSSASIGNLKLAAPYVITVRGPANDQSAINFARYFYSDYLETFSVESALNNAQTCLRSLGMEEGLQLVVSRRAEETHSDRTLIRALSTSSDKILIDITEIQESIKSLGAAGQEFLSLLTNKIRIHRWLIFGATDMANAILPIGRFFGVFSWKNGMDVITCRKIIRLKKDVPEHYCAKWMHLAFAYNLLFRERYRAESGHAYLGVESKLHRAISGHESVIKTFFDNEESVKLVKEIIPDQGKLAVPLIITNFNQAVKAFDEKDFPQTVSYLETTLSLIHGILDGIMEVLSD